MLNNDVDLPIIAPQGASLPSRGFACEEAAFFCLAVLTLT